MLNKVEGNNKILSAHTHDLQRRESNLLVKTLSRITDYSNLALIGIYFGILFFLNSLAYKHLEHSSSDTISLFFAIAVIQFGLGFILISMTIKKDGSNR